MRKRHYRGRRAGRLVQARRLRAINNELQRRLDYDRAPLSLSGPGPASGTEARPPAQTRDRPGLTADGCQEGSGSVSSRRVGSHLPLLQIVTPPRLTARQTAQVRPGPDTTAGRKINIGHANVQSIIPKMDCINHVLKEQNLDIFCLSETWLTEIVKDRVLIFPGYQIVRRDRTAPSDARRRAAPNRGGGVAILYRDTLNVTALPVVGSGPCETLWVNVSGGGHRAVTVGVAYRPPSSSLPDSLDDLYSQLHTVHSAGKPVFLLGDFNINLLRPTEPSVRRYLSMLSDLSLFQLVTKPTHVNSISSSLIDHIISNQPNVAVEVLPEPIADHRTIIVRPSFKRLKCRPKPFTTRMWQNVNWDKLCLDLLYADWASLYEANTVDEKLDAFLRVWWSVADVHCPVKTILPRRPHCPWLKDSPELTKSMRERDDAFQKWCNSRTESDRDVYRRLRNRVKNLFAKAKRDFLCNDMLSDKSSFWRGIRNFALRPAKGGGGGATDMPPEIADDFNRHFASVGSRINAELAAGNPPPIPPRPPCVVASSFRLYPATLPELSRAISELSSSRAVGHDGLPLYVIRHCLPVLGPHILHLVNTSIISCTFPTSWKLASVVPLHKSGSISDANNFRPISLLPALSKICEKIVCTQLSSYLSSCHALSPSQYAYRKCHSTEDALVDAVEWITRRVDTGHVAAVTSIDLSRAFDSVDHGVLLTKLKWYGIDVAWFKSYLGDRRQVVRGGSLSLPVSCGVPQGSLVGPILFSIFTNDLPSYIPHGRLVSYADDTQLLDSAHPDDLSRLMSRQEETLKCVSSYFTSNSLKMNPTKTTLILVGTAHNLKKASSFHINIADHTLIPSPSVKMLGVTLDRSLSWDEHISSVVKKCHSTLVCLYKIRHHLTPEARKLLIQAHVFPHILYCLSVWGGAAACHMARIQKLINFGARIVTGTPMREHISPVLKSLGWPSVRDLVAHRDCMGVFRALSESQAPLAVRSLFCRRADVSQRTTRATAAGELELPAFRLSLSRRAFSYRAASTWNHLPPATTASRTRTEFARRLSPVVYRL